MSNSTQLTSVPFADFEEIIVGPPSGLPDKATAAVHTPPTAPADNNALTRLHHSLDELQRLCDLLAVEDGYEPAVRDFVVPRGFKLSVVIPVYNEAATIQTVLARVAALPIPKEIIIVDDASTDGTRQILSEYECAGDVHVIFKPQNEGKGAALRTGFRRVTGDVIVVQDADLEYDPRDILPVVKPIVQGEADVVYGSRFLCDRPQDRSVVHRTGNRLLTAASNLLTGLAITDMETCYKAFRREVLRSFEIRQNRFGFEPEVTAKIARRNFRLAEVPVRYAARGYDAGKKIGVPDLFNALYCILRYGCCD
jgi:glycosyltransferase involved in cell wall biosynthesis